MELNSDQVAPVASDPVATAETAMRCAVVDQAKATLGKLVALIDPESLSVARTLFLIEEAARHYADLIVTFGAAEARPRQGAQYNGNYMPAVPVGAPGEPVEMLPGGETFGAQLIQQLVPVFTDLMKWFMEKKKELSVPPVTGVLGQFRSDPFERESLIRSIASAKQAGLDDVVDKLKLKLDELLAEPAVVAASPEGEEEVDNGQEAPAV
jgi:hypothetical protein